MKAHAGSLLFVTALMGVMVMLIASCGKPHEATGTLPPSTTMSTEIKDTDVTWKVKSALVQDETLNSFDIAVVVLKGDVRLTGVVNNQSQIDRVDKLVRSIKGVHNIHDELSIKR